MKILYRQVSYGEKGNGLLSAYGIKNCYFKSIAQTSGEGCGTKKRHSHNGFEFHIMLEGCQIYESLGGRFSLDGGKILAIPKGVPHSLVSAVYPIRKFAFTFELDDGFFGGADMSDCILFDIPERILSDILAIDTFYKDAVFRKTLLENAVFEAVLLLLSEIGMPRLSARASVDSLDGGETDERVELAIQFIRDNIENPLLVSEVASYCYISEKHLNRLFLSGVGISVAAYIRKERLARIEELLTDTRLPLSEISERFGFPTEHGFNSFFKKYNGMPPGEYRKMTKNGNGR